MSALKRKCSTYLWLTNDSHAKRRVLYQSHVTNEKYNEKQEYFLTSNNVPFIRLNSLFFIKHERKHDKCGIPSKPAFSTSKMTLL